MWYKNEIILIKDNQKKWRGFLVVVKWYEIFFFFAHAPKKLISLTKFQQSSYLPNVEMCSGSFTEVKKNSKKSSDTY